MKKIRILLTVIMLFSITILSSLYLTKDIHTAEAAGRISINELDFTLEVEHYKTLRVSGTTAKPTYLSKNTKVATVSAAGRVTAKGWGSTTIAVKVAGKTYNVKLNVVQLNKKNLTLATNDSFTLNLWGANKAITWTSDNTKVATVSTDGKVTAKALGTAKITAKLNGQSITSNITVLDISETSLVMDATGKFGFVKTLKVNGANKPITWSSSNNSIAVVNSNGRVFAKGAGTAIITATVDGATLRTQVRVLQMNTTAFTIKKGESFNLNVLGTNNTISWSSYKNSVATVDNNGKVTAKSEGEATIIGTVEGRRVRSRVTVVE